MSPQHKYKRRSFDIGFKLQVVAYANENSGEAAARKFNVDPASVRDWKRQLNKLRDLESTKSTRKIMKRQRLNGGGRKPISKAEQAKRDKNLQITIQQSLRGQSVNNSNMKWTKNEPLGQSGKLNSTFLCEVCNICIPRKDIQIHFNDKLHLERCKFLESVRESKMASMGLSAPELSSTKPGDASKYCSVCRIHFTGTVIQHRQTPEHKGLKAMSRPFCALCSQFFKSPAKYVRHCNSLAHKQHLVKSTAEHCGKPDSPTVKSKDITDEAQKCVIGTSSIVPVKGFYCKLCHKFFFTRRTAIDQHCRNAIHLKNFKDRKLGSNKTNL